MANTFSTLTLAVLAACAEPAAPAADAPLPASLAETGFGGDGVRPFTPQYPLWTDGAAKRRFISLPAAIDASGDAWQFPVGTKLWKEFVFGGVVAETRYMERTARGWRYTTFAADTQPEVAPGVRHRVPSAADCRICHTDGPLGFTALQLSPDRDPAAVHREEPVGIDLSALRAENLVAGYRGPAAPRIPARNDVERAALGYLHANCGGCHNPRTPLVSLDMSLADGDVLASTIARASRYAPARARIAPGEPDASVIVERMRSRDPVAQMPPLGTQLVDAEGVALVAAWIATLP